MCDACVSAWLGVVCNGPPLHLFQDQDGALGQEQCGRLGEGGVGREVRRAGLAASQEERGKSWE